MFDESSLTNAHFRALTAIEKWVNKAETPPIYKHCWDKIFKSGEGLYSAYLNSKLKSTEKIKKFIQEIEKKFSEERARILLDHPVKNKKQVSEANQCFETFATVAFQTGFLMAVDYLAKNYHNSSRLEASNSLSSILINIDKKKWIAFFTDFRSAYVRQTDPKSWPAYQKMVLRLLTSEYDDLFESKKGDELPEVKILKNKIESKIDQHYDTSDKPLKQEVLDEWIEEDIKETKKIMNKIVKDCLGTRQLRQEGKRFSETENEKKQV
jgi:hypothetical protein